MTATATMTDMTDTTTDTAIDPAAFRASEEKETAAAEAAACRMIRDLEILARQARRTDGGTFHPVCLASDNLPWVVADADPLEDEDHYPLGRVIFGREMFHADRQAADIEATVAFAIGRVFLEASRAKRDDVAAFLCLAAIAARRVLVSPGEALPCPPAAPLRYALMEADLFTEINSMEKRAWASFKAFNDAELVLIDFIQTGLFFDRPAMDDPAYIADALKDGQTPEDIARSLEDYLISRRRLCERLRYFIGMVAGDDACRAHREGKAPLAGNTPDGTAAAPVAGLPSEEGR